MTDDPQGEVERLPGEVHDAIAVLARYAAGRGAVIARPSAGAGEIEALPTWANGLPRNVTVADWQPIRRALAPAPSEKRDATPNLSNNGEPLLPAPSARDSIYEECAKIAGSVGEHMECEHLGSMDTETGVRECERRGDCLCAERIEEGEKIAALIRSRLSSLPPAVEKKGVTE